MRSNTHERVLPFTDAVTTEVNREWSMITETGKETDGGRMMDGWWTDGGQTPEFTIIDYAINT